MWDSSIVPQDLDVWKLVEDDSNYNQQGVNSPPVAFEIQTNQTHNTGEYIYRLELRTKLVQKDFPQFYQRKDLKIEIRPCETYRTEPGQDLGTQVVYYQQPYDLIRWRDFKQYPSCNYRWNYEVYMRSDQEIKLFSEIKQL